MVGRLDGKDIDLGKMNLEKVWDFGVKVEVDLLEAFEDSWEKSDLMSDCKDEGWKGIHLYPDIRHVLHHLHLTTLSSGSC